MIARITSWTLVALLSLWCGYMVYENIQDMVNGSPTLEVHRLAAQDSQSKDEKDIEPEDLKTALMFQEIDDKVDGGVDKSRDNLIFKLARRFNLDRKDISLEPSGRRMAEIVMRVPDGKDDPREFEDCVEKLQLAFQVLDIDRVIVTQKDSNVSKYYSVDAETLQFGVSQDLIFNEKLRELANSTSGPVSTFLNNAARSILKDSVAHLDRTLKSKPIDPQIVLYRYILHKELGADTTADCAEFSRIEEDAYGECPRLSDLASKLNMICGCTNSGAHSAENVVKYIRENVFESAFRAYLLRGIYLEDHQPKLAAEALAEADKDRNDVWRSCGLDLALIGFSTFALLFYLFFVKKKFWTLPSEVDSVACPQVYGWAKTLIVIVAILFAWTMGFAFIYAAYPTYLELAGDILDAYFEPRQSALCALFIESLLTIPPIIITYSIVGNSVTLFQFVKLHLRTKTHSTIQLVRVGLETFVISWFPAMVGILFSLWFHHPPEQTSSIATEILSGSGNVPAILILFFAFAILGPIAEEMCFRGILHPALRRSWSMIPAMIFGSLLFALLHMEMAPWWFFDKIVFAALNTYAYEKTGSIVPGIVNHILTNSLVFIFLVISNS